MAVVAEVVGRELAAALQLMGELPIEGTPFGDPATSPPAYGRSSPRCRRD